MAENRSRYLLSFTSGGLLVNEAGQTIPVWQREQDWARVRAVLMESNTLQLRTLQSRRTVSREVVGRMSELSADELHVLATGALTERAHLMWVAVCRRYALIAEFAEEVLRERFHLLRPSLSRDDFDGFLRSKALWHPELDKLTDNTKHKLRQNMFRMLREAGLIDEDRSIPEVFLSPAVENALGPNRADNIKWFPTSTEAHA